MLKFSWSALLFDSVCCIFFVEILAIGSFFRDLNCLTSVLVQHSPKWNTRNAAIKNYTSYDGCHLLLLCTRDALSRSFLGFKCFSGVLNFLNSENSLLSRILFGLFPQLSCLHCEPICPIFIPAGMLHRSLIYFACDSRTSWNSVTHKLLSSTFTYFFRFLPIRFPPLPLPHHHLLLLLRPSDLYSFMDVSPAVYTTVSSFHLLRPKRNLPHSTYI